ncbi:MAG: hypothetical protein Q4C47_09100, partial [Planctomycetia bacterium]|nr:hypothetical protein [Planctomycetia bacterium]
MTIMDGDVRSVGNQSERGRTGGVMMSIPLEHREEHWKLTMDIVDTYAFSGGITHLDACPLPNYDAVIEAAQAVKEILYPGYHHRDGLHMGNIVYHVGEQLGIIYDRLQRQVSCALCHQAGQNQ